MQKKTNSNINGDTKVRFILSIGYLNACREETFTLRDLGYDPKIHTELSAFLYTRWDAWKNKYLDGDAIIYGSSDH